MSENQEDEKRGILENTSGHAITVSDRVIPAGKRGYIMESEMSPSIELIIKGGGLKPITEEQIEAEAKIADMGGEKEDDTKTPEPKKTKAQIDAQAAIDAKKKD